MKKEAFIQTDVHSKTLNNFLSSGHLTQEAPH